MCVSQMPGLPSHQSLPTPTSAPAPVPAEQTSPKVKPAPPGATICESQATVNDLKIHLVLFFVYVCFIPKFNVCINWLSEFLI